MIACMGLKEDITRLKELYTNFNNTRTDISKLKEIISVYNDITFDHLEEYDLLKSDDVYNEVSKNVESWRKKVTNYEVKLLLKDRELKMCLQLWRFWGFSNNVYDVSYYSKEDYYSKLITIYDRLKPNEDDISRMAEEVLSVYDIRLHPSNEYYVSHDCNGLMLLNGICKYYHEYIEFIRDVIVNQQYDVSIKSPGSSVLPKELNTHEAKELFSQIPNCVPYEGAYKWNGSMALFGYFVEKTSETLNIRHDNNRIPWGIYKTAFNLTDKNINTAKDEVNKRNNAHKPEPEGFDKIKIVCK